MQETHEPTVLTIIKGYWLIASALFFWLLDATDALPALFGQQLTLPPWAHRPFFGICVTVAAFVFARQQAKTRARLLSRLHKQGLEIRPREYGAQLDEGWLPANKLDYSLASRFTVSFGVTFDIMPHTEQPSFLNLKVHEVDTDWRLKAHLLLDEARVTYRVGRGAEYDKPLAIYPETLIENLRMKAEIPVELSGVPDAVAALGGLTRLTVTICAEDDAGAIYQRFDCDAMAINRKIESGLAARFRSKVQRKVGNAGMPHEYVDELMEVLRMLWS